MFSGKWFCVLGIVVASCSVTFSQKEPNNADPEDLARILAETKRDMEVLEYISNGGDEGAEDEDTGRAINIKDKAKKMKDKLKELCSCKSHKECGCCIKKTFKLKVIGEFSPKVCTTVTIKPESKIATFALSFGPVDLAKKDVSFKKTERMCKKIEFLKSINVCMNLKVEEHNEKGLMSCVKLEMEMGIFNKPLILPCLNFKNGKLSVDESYDENEEDGVKVNIWNPVKKGYKWLKEKLG